MGSERVRVPVDKMHRAQKWKADAVDFPVQPLEALIRLARAALMYRARVGLIPDSAEGQELLDALDAIELVEDSDA